MPFSFKKSSKKSSSSVASDNGGTVNKSINGANDNVNMKHSNRGTIGNNGGTGAAGGGTNYRVQIPTYIQPGQEFQVTAGSRIVRVRCPDSNKGGDFVMITIPDAPPEGALPPPPQTPQPQQTLQTSQYAQLPPQQAPPSHAAGSSSSVGSSNFSTSSPQYHQLHQPRTATFRIIIPQNVQPGQVFQAYIGTPGSTNNQKINIKCPMNCRPGHSIDVPIPVDENGIPIVTRNASNTRDSVLTQQTQQSQQSTSNNQIHNRSNSMPAQNVVAPTPNPKIKSYSERSMAAPPMGQMPHTQQQQYPQHQHQMQNTQQYQQHPQHQVHPNQPMRPNQPKPAVQYTVTIPPGIQPGVQFPVKINGQTMFVTCPPGAREGTKVRIVPPTSITNNASRTSPSGSVASGSIGGAAGGAGGAAVRTAQDLRNAFTNMANEPVYSGAPQNRMPHMNMQQNSQGGLQGLQGDNNRVSVEQDDGTVGSQRSQQSQPEFKTFEVSIPPGIQPGQPFPIRAEGLRVLVTCPMNAREGQTIRFDLPYTIFQSTQQPQRPSNSSQPPSSSEKKPAISEDAKSKKDALLSKQPSEIQLTYEKLSGWARTLCKTSDPADASNSQSFKWIRYDSDGIIDSKQTPDSEQFELNKSAFVRQVQWRQPHPTNRGRLWQGSISLVHPTQSLTPTQILWNDNGRLDDSTASTSPNYQKTIVSCSDLISAQTSSTLDEKILWFNSACNLLQSQYDKGFIRIHIRRPYLMMDSIEAVMSLSAQDLRRRWRFDFVGEIGLDVGGLAREWFHLVTEGVFDPDFGLFVYSKNNQMCMQINPTSGTSYSEDHMLYYRFIGRVMGKAIFDQQQLHKGHLVKYLYKHILGLPINFSDLQDIVDEDYRNNLKKVYSYTPEVLEALMLDFTVTEEVLGVKKEIELIPDGASTDVTTENLPQYVEACLKYHMLGRYESQLNQMVLGFYEVIPEPLLTIFDPEEFELLMCGKPEIDVEDWKKNTEYAGEFVMGGPNHRVCVWFWEIVEEFEQEMRANLLQFVTGTSGVPARGFSVLQGVDGSIRRFTVMGVAMDESKSPYPTAHTCFNRVDIPLYETKQELKEKLEEAITLCKQFFNE